jgi:Helix-turn-helix domain
MYMGVNQIHRKHRPINRYERAEIFAFAAAGLSQRRIGKILDRKPAVIRHVVLDLDWRGNPRRHGGQNDTARLGPNPAGGMGATGAGDHSAD